MHVCIFCNYDSYCILFPLFFELQPRVDDKHSRWLHLRIRPATFPFAETAGFGAQQRTKSKALVDGRWTLAFRDEVSCKSAFSMIVEELNFQSSEVKRRLTPLLDLEKVVDYSNSSDLELESSSSRTPPNSL